MYIYLYILSLIFTIGCNVKIEESVQKSTTKELIKDSLLLNEINNFIISLEEKEINDNFLLILKFDSIEYNHHKYIEILMYIAPCISEVHNTIGGYINNIPIIIKDEMNIGQFYYNNIIIDSKINKSFFCKSNDIDSEYQLFDESIEEKTKVGQSFIVTESNELMLYSIVFNGI